MNEANVNQYTLHTGTNGGQCKLDPNADPRYNVSQSKSFLGNPLGLECKSADGANAGCGVNDFDGSAGGSFNKANGGVIAMLWDETQVTIWRFGRNQIPNDIQTGNPNPDTWGTPVAYWSDKSCDIAGSFRDNKRAHHPYPSL